jgi:hypothetical protein
MATPKYKKMFEEMLQSNKQLFADYNELLAKYDSDNTRYAQELSEMQRKLLRIIKNTENGLCARTENTGRGNYSTALADKFWNEVRTLFPRVEDYIKVN